VVAVSLVKYLFTNKEKYLHAEQYLEAHV
jgi:hypothetical protein